MFNWWPSLSGTLAAEEIASQLASLLAQAKTRGTDPALLVGLVVIRPTLSMCRDDDTAGGTISG